jgi:hypothetical protein
MIFLSANYLKPMNKVNTNVTFRPTHPSHRRFQLNYYNNLSETLVIPYQNNKSTLIFWKGLLLNESTLLIPTKVSIKIKLFQSQTLLDIYSLSFILNICRYLLFRDIINLKNWNYSHYMDDACPPSPCILLWFVTLSFREKDFVHLGKSQECLSFLPWAVLMCLGMSASLLKVAPQPRK